uniref:Uncharacterized protein n=1 Tax=Sus scrofa TaxID=9823 RepID=A0A8D1L9D6_PIG
EKGGEDGGLAASQESPGLGCPQNPTPHLVQQAATATARPAAGTAASPTTASATTGSPTLSSRRRHLSCLCVSLPSYLSEADWLELAAWRAARSTSGPVVQGWLTRGCQRKWPRGLLGLVVIRSSSHRLPPTRPAVASRLLRVGEGSGKRHRGATPRSPGGSPSCPPDRDVAPAETSEAEATPEAGKETGEETKKKGSQEVKDQGHGLLRSLQTGRWEALPEQLLSSQKSASDARGREASVTSLTSKRYILRFPALETLMLDDNKLSHPSCFASLAGLRSRFSSEMGLETGLEAGEVPGKGPNPGCSPSCGCLRPQMTNRIIQCCP